MKKFTLVFSILFSVLSSFSQVNLVVEAPLNSSSSNTNRAPNGTAAHAFHSSCFLVLQSELINMPSGTNITSFGYTINPATGATMPVPGNYTVYLQNTSNNTYQKGTVFSTALIGMTPVFASILTIPSVGATSVVVTLSTPFPYTGGGMYVACDWASVGPFSATGALFWGETAVFPLPAGGGAVAYSQLSAQTTLTLTAARPSFLFGFTNSNTNDIQVITIEAMGKVCAPFNTPHTIKAYVKNLSTGTKTSIGVNLNVTGANLFSNPQTISSLAPGVGTWVTFPTFNPQVLGTNIMSVSVASDQNNLNNSATHTQVVTCDQWSPSPPAGNYTVNTLGFAAPTTGLIAAAFPNPVASIMTGLRLAVGGATTALNQPLYGVLTDASGVLLASTNIITITSFNLGTWQNFSFPTPQNLTANTTYYIGYSQSVAGASFAGAFNSYIPVSYVMYYNNTITGAPMLVNPGVYGYLGIEAVFAPSGVLNIVSTPTAICVGSCAVLTAPTGVNNYTWSTGSTAANISACPLGQNTYSIVGTNTMGCPATGTISIPVNPLPNVTISAPANAICIGNPVTFTANGAVSYSLNNVASPAAITQTPLASTGYTITGVDANGCVNTASLAVSVFSLNVTFPPNGSVCKGKTITLSIGPSTYAYVWTDGVITYPFQSPSVTPSVSTVYTVTASDVNNCSLSGTVLVTVNPNPTVTASSSKATICKGESVKLTALGADTYTWNGNGAASSTVILSPISPTTYVVAGTTTAGCTHTATIIQLVVACTAIGEFQNTNAGISIFPNPGNGIFNLNCESFERPRTIEIFNTLGALIMRVGISSEKTVLDLSNESNGVYIVQVIENNKTIRVSKIIKQ